MNTRTDETQATAKVPLDARFVYLADGMAPLKARQIGLVPGAEVPLLPVDLPPALNGHAREKVALRQLGDGLGVSLDSLNLRPFHPSGNTRTWTRMLVAEKTDIARWRALGGPGGTGVLPDYLALPAAPDLWVLSQSSDTLVARLGPGDGFSATPTVARHLLQTALNQAAAPPRAVYCTGAVPPDIEALFTARDIPLAGTEAALNELGIDPPRVLAHGELDCDLRSDPRAARAQLARRVLPWRWPLLAGLLAAGLWAGAQLLAIENLRAQTDQFRAATLQVVRDSFVPEGPILDIRTQVGRALAEARVASVADDDSVAPLDLLGLATSVLAAEGARPVSLDYTTVDGLTAVLRVADFAAAEDLALALTDAGLAVRVVESRADGGDDGVRTELNITASTGETAKDQP